MRRRINQVNEIKDLAFHCATVAAAAAAIAFAGLMCAMYQLCAANGSTCGLIAKPVTALAGVGPGVLVAAVAGWLCAARKARRQAP